MQHHQTLFPFNVTVTEEVHCAYNAAIGQLLQLNIPPPYSKSWLLQVEKTTFQASNLHVEHTTSWTIHYMAVNISAHC